MAITDLTGTKWRLQDKYSEFTENTLEELFCSLKAEDVHGVLLEYDFAKFGTIPVRPTSPSFFLEGWTTVDSTIKTMRSVNDSAHGLCWSLDSNGYSVGRHMFHTPLVEITGGAGATDADVIAWFEANATQVVDGANNKVVLGDGTVVMDITDTTAEEADVVSGKVFYKSNGTRSTGSAVITPVDQTYDPTSTNAQSGTAVAEAVAGAGGASLVTQTQTTPGEPVTATLTDGDYGLRFDEAGNEIQIDFSDGNQTNTRFLAKSAYVNGITGDLSNLTTDNKTNLVSAINEVYEKSGEPFRVKNWAASGLSVSIPYCTEDLDNTSIAKMDFSISGEEGDAYQVVGMVAYEVKGTDGKRINCWPVCQFTGNGQKTLSVRWMCAGTSRKTAAAINAWVLIKHR